VAETAQPDDADPGAGTGAETPQGRPHRDAGAQQRGCLVELDAVGDPHAEAL